MNAARQNNRQLPRILILDLTYLMALVLLAKTSTYQFTHILCYRTYTAAAGEIPAP